MQLAERLRRRHRVVVPDLRDADHCHPSAYQRLQLARRDSGRDEIPRPRESMDVGVTAARTPAALHLQAVFFECEQQRLDGSVELQAEAHRVEPEPGERVVRLRLENGLEVVDDLHRPGI